MPRDLGGLWIGFRAQSSLCAGLAVPDVEFQSGVWGWGLAVFSVRFGVLGPNLVFRVRVSAFGLGCMVLGFRIHGV